MQELGHPSNEGLYNVSIIQQGIMNWLAYYSSK